MAPRSNTASDVSCRKCTKEVKIFVLCGKCESKYHPSCVLKIPGTFVNSKGTVICCGNQQECECKIKDDEIIRLKMRISNINESLFEKSIIDSNNPENLEVMEDRENIVTNKTDVSLEHGESHFLKIIIDQKDYIIAELNDKVDILRKHINLLEKLEVTRIENDNIQRKHSKKLNKYNKNKSNDDKGNSNILIPKRNPDSMITDKNDDISDLSEISQPIPTAPCVENIELEADSWQYVAHKKGRSRNEYEIKEREIKSSEKPKSKPTKKRYIRENNQFWNITGGSTINPVKAIQKKTALFVSRISTDTTLDQFTSMVKQSFPEAECQSVKSRFPDKYSSFKVVINENNFEMASNSNTWPKGAYITKFFQRKTGISIAT